MISLPETKALLTALQAISHACPAKDNRLYLNGIRFEVVGAELHLVATDGHRLAHAIIACDPASTPCQFTLTPAAVKNLVAHLQALVKAGRQSTSIRPDFESCAVYCQDADGMGCPFAMLRGEAGSHEKYYPDWRRVQVRPGMGMDNPSERTDGELFNPEYLVDAYKACSIVCKGAGKTVHEARTLLTRGDRGNQRALIQVCAGGVELECVVMGLRG